MVRIVHDVCASRAYKIRERTGVLQQMRKLNPDQPVADTDIGENFSPDEAEYIRSAASVSQEIGALGEHAVASGPELKQIEAS